MLTNILKNQPSQDQTTIKMDVLYKLCQSLWEIILMSQIWAPNLRNDSYSINNKLKLIIID